MKTNIFKQMRLWLPVMCATMMLAACSSDDSNADPKPGPSPEPEVKSIFYTATVGGDTRATVDGNNKTLKFALGDKLYISSDNRTDLKGYLTLTSGAGTTNEATFSGTLYYTGDLPESNTSVTGTLVGVDNVSLTTTGGKVTGTPNYGTGLVLPDGESTAVNEAVKKYGYLTCAGTFGAKAFNYLTQQTAFLNFTVNVKTSGVNVDDEYNVTVAGVGTDHSGTVKITASGSDKVLKFAVPISPQAIPNARVILYNNNVIPFGRTTALVAKVYNVSREIDNNYDYVDLGLSVKWAKTNLGAMTETGYGKFYAWAGTTGHVTTDTYTFTQANAPYYSGSGTDYTKYNTTEETNLLSVDDAATAALGTGWRMPTKAEFQELLDNSTVVWQDNYNGSGIKGYLFTSTKTNYTDKSIFLPSAGRKTNETPSGQATSQNQDGAYWLSTHHTTAGGAWSIGFSEYVDYHSKPALKGIDRFVGMTIRPVYKP